MDNLKAQISADKLPKHIAIIMDGNGRWAKEKGMPRVLGHRGGVQSVREVVEACGEIGIQFLTLYAFSTENWSRPASEVSALMTLLVSTIRQELDQLDKNNVRLMAIGALSDLPKQSYEALTSAIKKTQHNTGLTLILAINYSAKWEILNAVKALAQQTLAGQILPAEIDEQKFEEKLSTYGIPDPELLIRTSGETRISNFLLWQIAYTELYFSPVFWPDFRKKDLFEAVLNYQRRERRFGMISEQIA
jgi:undecaprenyl diphosphate synthase